jgi:molecular chaperone DnaJ
MTTATLGGSIELPAIDGSRARIAVPAGAQSGQRLRLKGKGMSVLRSSARGDLYVELSVETPIHLSKRQQELLQELAKSGIDEKKHSPHSAGFAARIKTRWDETQED